MSEIESEDSHEEEGPEQDLDDVDLDHVSGGSVVKTVPHLESTV